MVSIAPYSVGEIISGVVMMWLLLLKVLIVLGIRYVRRKEWLTIAVAGIVAVAVCVVQFIPARIGAVFFMCGVLLSVAAWGISGEVMKWFPE